MKTYSISRYLTASLIITVALVSTISIIAIYFETAFSAKKDLENKADEIVRDLVKMLEFPLWVVSEESVRMTGSAIAQNEVVSRLFVKNHRGEIVYFFEKEHDDNTVNRYEKIYYEGDFIGDVELALSKQLYQQDQQKLLIRYVFILRQVPP